MGTAVVRCGPANGSRHVPVGAPSSTKHQSLLELVVPQEALVGRPDTVLPPFGNDDVDPSADPRWLDIPKQREIMHAFSRLDDSPRAEGICSAPLTIEGTVSGEERHWILDWRRLPLDHGYWIFLLPGHVEV